MHRRPLTALLARYAEVHPDEAQLAWRFGDFMASRPDCLLRTCEPGHITASAWILSADGGTALLARHRKLQRWLQLGGHVDGEARVELAALREAREESGMEHLELLTRGGEVLPLDLDVHPIPGRPSEPAHLHWDVRFLLRAGPGQVLRVSEESHDLQWVAAADLADFTTEESVLRLPRKAARWTDGS